MLVKHVVWQNELKSVASSKRGPAGPYGTARAFTGHDRVGRGCFVLFLIHALWADSLRRALLLAPNNSVAVGVSRPRNFVCACVTWQLRIFKRHSECRRHDNDRQRNYHQAVCLRSCTHHKSSPKSTNDSSINPRLATPVGRRHYVRVCDFLDKF